MNQTTFRGRAFTALVMLFAFIVLIVSGVILYIVPRGRTAHALDWHLLALDKTEWSALHMAFGILFVVAGLFHILFNRKALAAYVRRKWQERRDAPRPAGIKLEAIVATLLTILLVVASANNLPPVSTLIDLHRDIKDQWEAPADDGRLGRHGG